MTQVKTAARHKTIAGLRLQRTVYLGEHGWTDEDWQ